MVSSDIGGAAVRESVPLAPLTTLRIGPVARTLITCDSTERVVAALGALPVDAPAERVLVLAGGSNVVIADDLTDLTVVLLANTEITVDGHLVRAEAGALWDDVVVTALAHGLGGLECLSGIPGSAGATPVQNVGAYGAEVADTISRVRLLDRRTGEDRWVAPGELGFGYRHSVLKNSDARRGARGRVRARRDGAKCTAALRRDWPGAGRRRQVSGPIRTGCAKRCWRCGQARAWCSTRTTTTRGASGRSSPIRSSRPRCSSGYATGHGDVPNYPAPDGVKLAAGWLVERAGFGKGFPGDGAPARLSTKHALALTNRGYRHDRRRDCAGQNGARRRTRRIRDRTHTRACPDRVRDLGNLGTREHEPAAGTYRARGGRIWRTRRLRR